MSAPSPLVAPSLGQSNSDRKKQAVDKGKNLVLCFDGTANEYTDTNTHIVKLFTFLEKDSPEQLCYYQTGVGTYIGTGFIGPITKRIAKAAGLGVAWYLDEHVMGGYRFLQTNYRTGDRIYLFGFSRGAYTARALAGMLYTVGLLPRCMPEQVPFAYEIFKKQKESASYKQAFSRDVTIEFIAVFDTVSSVGALYPRVLPFSSDNHITKTFRDAMALDEHRAKFRSNPWNLSITPEIDDPQPHAGVFRTSIDDLKKTPTQGPSDEGIASSKDHQELGHKETLDCRPPTDVKEVWFAGCHCDVGGGNAKDSDKNALANIPLKWMLKEIIASDTQLIFRRSAMKYANINVHELVQAAERTKLEDAKHKQQLTTENLAALAEVTTEASASQKFSTAALSVSPKDGDPAEHIRDEDDGVVAKDQLDQSIHDLWKTTSGVDDAICKITDELAVAPMWWLLEFLPFIDSYQDQDGRWINWPRVNLFRPRDIPHPPAHTNPNSQHNSSNSGVFIGDAPLFHVSVKHRMDSEEANTASWWMLWRKKDVPYTPKAWPSSSKPVCVE